MRITEILFKKVYDFKVLIVVIVEGYFTLVKEIPKLGESHES